MKHPECSEVRLAYSSRLIDYPAMREMKSFFFSSPEQGTERPDSIVIPPYLAVDTDKRSVQKARALYSDPDDSV